MQLPAPAAALYVPAPHATHATPSVSAVYPAKHEQSPATVLPAAELVHTQSVTASLPAAEVVFAGHAVMIAPPGHHDPASHVAQESPPGP